MPTGFLPYALGAVCFIAMACMSALSGHFVFGEGHAARPISLFLGLYAIAWIAFAAAVVFVKRGRAPGIFCILLVALAMRLVFAASNPIQENDGYRYVLDGAVVAAGGNPFAYSPDDMRDHAPLGVWNDLRSDKDAQQVFNRISYREIPTIYPPVAQISFAVGHWLLPWRYAGQRLVFIVWDLGTIALIVFVLGRAALPQSWVLFYAWNPLVIKEIANSAHSDSAAGFFLVACVGALLMLQGEQRVRWALLGGLCLGGAILARMYPVMLVPVCAAIVFRSGGLRALGWFGASLSAAIAIAYLPFLTVPFEQLTEGLRTYGEYWRRNDGAYAIIDLLFPQPRLVASLITASTGIGAALWYVGGKATFERGVCAIQVVILAWLLFAPASYPWYAVALMALCALRPRPWAVVMSGAYALYYLLFYFSYREMGSAWSSWAQAIEHSAIWLSIGIPLLAAASAAATAPGATSAGRTSASTSTAGEKR